MEFQFAVMFSISKYLHFSHGFAWMFFFRFYFSPKDVYRSIWPLKIESNGRNVATWIANTRFLHTPLKFKSFSIVKTIFFISHDSIQKFVCWIRGYFLMTLTDRHETSNNDQKRTENSTKSSTINELRFEGEIFTIYNLSLFSIKDFS